MGNYSKKTSWDVQQRLAYIEFCAYWLGQVARKDICERYGISLQQVSADFQLYHELNPDALRYDLSMRRYKPEPHFKPHFIHPDDYLSAVQKFDPPHLQVTGYLRPAHFQNTPMLQKVVEAIHFNQALEITYYSAHSGTHRLRKIKPCKLVTNGGRFHVRSWCFENEEFRDFLPSRMEKATVVEDETALPADTAWETLLELTFQAYSPIRTKKEKQAALRAIELDYQMENGVLTLPCKQALQGYLLHDLGFLPDAKIGSINLTQQLKFSSHLNSEQ